MSACPIVTVLLASLEYWDDPSEHGEAILFSFCVPVRIVTHIAHSTQECHAFKFFDEINVLNQHRVQNRHIFDAFDMVKLLAFSTL